MIVVVSYGMGNVGALENMIRRAGGEALASSDPASAEQATKLVLPGVGAFDNGVKALHAAGWWERILAFAASGRPVLGVCLGLQLLARGSEEGVLPGLGLLDATVVRFRFPEGRELRVPHMGWNELAVQRPTLLLRGLERDARFYFAHSYHVVCRDPADVAGEADYGSPFVACVQRGNLHGTQFHPEKSHRFGLQLFRNFVEVV